MLRLMGCLVLFYTSRVICKGRMTMEEIIFSLKHYWRFVDSEALELKALSWGHAILKKLPIIRSVAHA